MKTAIVSLFVLSIAFSLISSALGGNLRLISKATDIYQVQADKAQLVETIFEVGTFTEVNGLAQNVKTFIETVKNESTSVDIKLQKILSMSGNSKETMTSKIVSDESCITHLNEKRCSTAIEIRF